MLKTVTAIFVILIFKLSLFADEYQKAYDEYQKAYESYIYHSPMLKSLMNEQLILKVCESKYIINNEIDAKEIEKKQNMACGFFSKIPSSNKNRQKAVDLLTKKCETENFNACYELSVFSRDGKKEQEIAIQTLTKACDNNIKESCVYLADYYKYLKDFNGNRNFLSEIDLNQKNVDIHEKTCKNYNYRCSTLAEIYVERKNYQGALELYEKLCKEGSIYDCNDFIEIYEKENINKDIFNITEIKIWYFIYSIINSKYFAYSILGLIFLLVAWYIIKKQINRHREFENKQNNQKKREEDDEKKYILRFEEKVNGKDNLIEKAIKMGEIRYLNLKLPYYNEEILLSGKYDIYLNSMFNDDNLELFKLYFNHSLRIFKKQQFEYFVIKQEKNESDFKVNYYEFSSNCQEIFLQALKYNAIKIAEFLCYKLSFFPFKANSFDILKNNIRLATILDLYINKVDLFMFNIEEIYKYSKETNRIDLVKRFLSSNPSDKFLDLCKNNCIEIVKSCIDSGVDVNLINNKYQTALMISVEKGHIEIVKLLLNAGAKLDLEDYNENTALMIAKNNNNLEIVKLLEK